MRLLSNNINLLLALVIFSDSRLAIYFLLFLILFRNWNYLYRFVLHNKTIFFGFIILLPYGIISGIIQNNPIDYVLRNSASNLFLLTIPIVLKLEKEEIVILARKALFIITLQYLIALLSLFIFKQDIYYSDNELIRAFIGYFSGGSSTGHFRLFSTKSTFAIFSALFLFEWDKNFKKISFISILFFLIISASKGLMLGVLATFGLYLLASLKKASVSGIISFILFSASLIFFNFGKVITAIFDPNDISNLTRLLQIEVLLLEGFPFGVGWGGELSNIIRDNESPYGFELAYFDLFHKLGLFSLFIIFFLLSSYLTGLKKVLFSQNNKKSLLALYPLIFLFPAIGNPTLLHPVNFILLGINILLKNKL